MPDTIRTLAELNFLFRDTAENEEISAQHIRDLMVSLMVHGEIGSGPKSAITLGTPFQALDLNVAGVIGRGLTIDETNKRIANVPVDMKADIALEVLFKGAANTTYEFSVFKNTHTTPVQIARMNADERIISAAQIGKISVSAAIQLAAGDTLQAGVRSAGASFELLRGNLKVRRIGVE